MRGSRPPRVLVVAGSDSGGGAGLQADLKTLAAFGVYSTSAVTVVTAQDTTGVHAGRTVGEDLLRAQLRAVLDDIGCDAIKVGALGDAANVTALADVLEQRAPRPLVLDPVLSSSSGHALLDAQGVEVLLERLLPRTTLLTPNLPELAGLTGLPVASLRERRAAAEALLERGASAVLVKGGHGGGEADGSGPVDGLVVDLLHDGQRLHRFEQERLPLDCHGTGCVLSSAIAGGLAVGLSLLQAVRRAREHLLAGMRTSVPVGAGASPVNAGLQRWGRAG